ncbi:MAG: SDR family oxidoreductase [Deltaproteobacteria bacterium]|nr:MAG: SDR family oxidoreductase [Deltaproteobacteria bacterium]
MDRGPDVPQVGRAHAHAAGARSRGQAGRVVGHDGARLRPELGPVVSTVIVTGAAKGIGAAIAEAFARAGWSLVAVDRDAAQLRAAASHWGQPVETLVGDVADRATNDAAVKMAIDRFGGLDAAVGNAGVVVAKLIDDSTSEEFDRIFSINVKALMYLAQAAHKALAKSEGSLTVIASKAGLVAQRNSPLYVATKGAAVQLARALALDWAHEGIRVNAVCPGIVDTPMLQEFFDAMPDPDASRRETEVAQPLGRLATPAEIASVVLFLATPAAAFITGVALPVDGGFTAE